MCKHNDVSKLSAKCSNIVICMKCQFSGHNFALQNPSIFVFPHYVIVSSEYCVECVSVCGVVCRTGNGKVSSCAAAEGSFTALTGLLEVEPLHFTCISTSDGTRVERDDASMFTGKQDFSFISLVFGS